MDSSGTFNGVPSRPLYHPSIKKSVQSGLSRHSPDPLAGTSTTSRSSTPARAPNAEIQPKPQHKVSVKPNVTVTLNALSSRPVNRDEYHEPKARYEETAKAPRAGGGDRAGASPTVMSDLSSNYKREGAIAAKATAMTEETPVPLSMTLQQRITQSRAQRQSLPQAAAPPQTPRSTTIATVAVQAPPSSNRGRPKGWKPGMSYSSMRGGEPRGQRPGRPAKPKAGVEVGGVLKRRGRPPKQPSPPPREIYRRQKVAFMAFLCEWARCKAELHNLETLRRHVYVVHLRYQEGMRQKCRWGKCGKVVVGEEDQNQEDQDQKEKKEEMLSGQEFNSYAELESHVKEHHLIPFGWHIGDGPKNSIGSGGRHSILGLHGEGRNIGDDDIPSYLKDGEGNQVTPSIKDQAVEDYATWRANRQKLKQLLLQRDANLPSDEENGPGSGEEMLL